MNWNNLGTLATAVVVAIAFSACNGHNAGWTSKRYLEQIAFAVDVYRETYGTFPPLFLRNANAQFCHSWRVLILPQVAANSFYDEYDFTTSWNSDTNADLRDATRWKEGDKFPNPAKIGEFYYETKGDDSFDTLFVALASAPLEERPYAWDQVGNFLPPDQPFIIIEIKNSGIHWMEPRDVTLTPGIVPEWKSLEEIKDQIVRSAEIGQETILRERDETLRFLEAKFGKNR